MKRWRFRATNHHEITAWLQVRLLSKISGIILLCDGLVNTQHSKHLSLFSELQDLQKPKILGRLSINDDQPRVSFRITELIYGQPQLQ